MPEASSHPTLAVTRGAAGVTAALLGDWNVQGLARESGGREARAQLGILTVALAAAEIGRAHV